MRICLVYDLFFPHTVGGAERWYRNVAIGLAERGYEVTYLTTRQWSSAEPPELPGVRIVPVARGRVLFAKGRRRIFPPLAFGLGVLGHLVRHGRRYDVVHTASFPYFSLLAAALVRPFARYRLFVDWHELWTRSYWREYLGALGEAGWQVQRLCLRAPQRAFCFSRLVESRLLAEEVHGRVTLLEGQLEEGQFSRQPPAAAQPAEPVVVFAGRHIAEKNPVAVVHAVAKARETIPHLKAEIYGDGPERPKVLQAIEDHGLEGVVEAPGFVDNETIEEALGRGLCLVLPSRREGYGLVVVEALSRGTPVVLVSGEDNAAAEFAADGENGFLAPTAGADDLARAISQVAKRGALLRASTLAWFAANASRLSLESSLTVLRQSYEAVD